MGAASRWLIGGLLFVGACGGETPPQLIRGQLEESSRPLIGSVVAMGTGGPRGRSDLDASGRFLLALPADQTDSYQIQLLGLDAQMIVPVAGLNGRLRVCEAGKEIDLGALHFIRGCEGACTELEVSLADCEQRNFPDCETARFSWQSCQQTAATTCMSNMEAPGECELQFCASEEQVVNAICVETCAPFAEGLERCLSAAQLSCVFPVVASSAAGLPSEIGCVLPNGVAGM